MGSPVLSPSSLAKFFRNPILCMRNAVYKVLIAPRRYKQGEDYDAARYWRDRLSKHGMSLQGVGDEGLSEEQNKEQYEAAAQCFKDICREQGIRFQEVSVAEVGVGTGFYASVLHEAGVRKYVGIDITDVLFSELRQGYPEWTFLKQDITAQGFDTEFDLIVMMDVVEHIVTEQKLAAAMGHVWQSLKPGGVFVISGIVRKRKRHLFYVQGWSADDVLHGLPGAEVETHIPYRSNSLLVIRKPS